MTTYNTRNPLGSSAAKDLFDNAQNLDAAVNDRSNRIWDDRFGQSRKTWYGIEKTAQDAIAAFGYVTIDSFEDGATLSLPNQVLRWKSNGEYYRWDGDLPKEVPAGSTPDSSGGVSAGAWLSVGDATLRGNLRSEGDDQGDALIAVKQLYDGAVARTQHEKNADVLTPADFSTSTEALSAAVSGSKWLHNSTQTFKLTVGSGGQFASLTDAINAACRIRPTYQHGNDFCVIELQSGFILNEQIEFKGGIDLGWIKITSVDSVVYANTESFTNSVVTYYDYKYLFYFHEKTTSPVFSILIEENRDSSDVVAFLASESSTIFFSSGSGARKFKGGVNATYGSSVLGLHSGTGTAPVDGYFLCDFSYCISFSVSAMLNCRISLPYSLFEHCSGQYAVFCIWSTMAEFRYSSASYSAGIGWYIRDGSIVSLREHKAVQCDIGIKAYHAAIIDARNHDTVDADGSIADPSVHSGVYGCKTAGIYMDGSCTVEASSTDMRNCGTAMVGYRNCKFTAQSSCLDGCITGIEGTTLCDFVVSRVSAVGVGKLCLIQHGCNLVAWVSNFTGPSAKDTRFVDVRLGSKASFYNLSIDTNSAIFAEDSSEINLTDCSIGAMRISAYYNSRANINESTWDFSRVSSGTPILNIQRGSFINAIGQRGKSGEALTLNVTALTTTIAGILFYN